MNAIKRFTAVFMAVLMLVTTSVVANAAVIDEEEKKYLTDEIFEWHWEGGLYVEYWQYTRSTVEIEHNPLAAMWYMRIEAQVEVCDDSILQDLSDGKITITEFYKKHPEFDFEKAKKKDKFRDSLLWGYEFGISDYQYGTWELELNDDDYTKVYGYFKEDAENFTLYEEDTNEILGVYPRLIGYDYLDDTDEDTGNKGNGGNTGGGNGNTGGSSSSNDKKTSGNVNSSTSSSTSSASSERDVKTTVSNAKTESSVTDKVSGEDKIEKYDPDGNNPAVTPEIASAVDEMKSAAQTQPTDEKAPAPTEPVQVDKPNHTVRNVILIIAAIAVVAVAAVMVLNKKKGEDNGK